MLAKVTYGIWIRFFFRSHVQVQINCKLSNSFMRNF